LRLKEPLSVALKLCDSVPVVALTVKVAWTLSVPVAPANLPVPFVTLTVPEMVTGSGAALVGAAEEVVDAVTFTAETVKDPPAPLRTAVPLSGSAELEVEKDFVAPLALKVPVPNVVPLPVPAMEPVTPVVPQRILTLPL
jgi:hypothetical protein